MFRFVTAIIRTKVCLGIFFFIILVLSTSFSQPALITTATSLFQKGMCYVAWDKEQFATELSEKSLGMLKKMGVEFVQINVTHYQDTYNSTEIKATDLTPSDSSVKHAIRYAHKLGMKVMLKPHVDLINTQGGTYWRADIGFNNEDDWKKWFMQYEKFIKHYAEMAGKLEVEIFCVGTELSFAAQKTECWNNIIDSVKTVYKGITTYAANWDDYKDVQFWNKLDYVGIDAYFPLSYKEKPSLEELKSGWEKWKYEIESWVGGVNKPVIFTEIGYASTPQAASEPWKSGESGNADVETQANCYKAFFETVWNSPWLAGVYWWKWAPTVYGGGEANRNFTPLNKPAATILEENYKARMTGELTQYATREEVEQKAQMLEGKEKTRGRGTYPMKEKTVQDGRVEKK